MHLRDHRRRYIDASHDALHQTQDTAYGYYRAYEYGGSFVAVGVCYHDWCLYSLRVLVFFTLPVFKGDLYD